MKSTVFDTFAKAWATGASRRQLLRSATGALAGLPFALGLARAVARQPEGTPETDLTERPVFEPLFPPLEPVPIGNNEFVIDGQTIAIDPDLAAELTQDPIAPIQIQGETTYISLDPALFDFGTPTTGMATPEASPVVPTDEGPCLGDDNSQDVEIYDRGGNLGVTVDFVHACEPTVGNLRWKNDLIKRFQNPGTVNNRRWCSGTLIADDLWLTAGHCFSQHPSGGQKVPTTDGTDFPISRAEIALNMQVDFHYQVDGQFVPRPVETIEIVELVEDRLGDLDYAIVRLASPPSHDYKVANVAPTDASIGSMISVIGHPRGEPKRVATGHASEYVNDRIYYNDLDTDYGSSGSAILSSPEGWIVGVHTTGGCDDERSGENSGFRISSLLRVSPTLRSLANA
jgi:hypothetical protein